MLVGTPQGVRDGGILDQTTLTVRVSALPDALPRAIDAPDFSIENHSVPCKTNRLGVKGCGEAAAGALYPAIRNALDDALAPLGAEAPDGAASPFGMWKAMRGAAAR